MDLGRSRSQFAIPEAGLGLNRSVLDIPQTRPISPSGARYYYNVTGNVPVISSKLQFPLHVTYKLQIKIKLNINCNLIEITDQCSEFDVGGDFWSVWTRTLC